MVEGLTRKLLVQRATAVAKPNESRLTAIEFPDKMNIKISKTVPSGRSLLLNPFALIRLDIKHD